MVNCVVQSQTEQICFVVITFKDSFVHGIGKQKER